MRGPLMKGKTCRTEHFAAHHAILGMGIANRSNFQKLPGRKRILQHLQRARLREFHIASEWRIL
jgi:hypothetical protein